MRLDAPFHRGRSENPRIFSHTVNLTKMDMSTENENTIADTDMIIEEATETGIELITTILDRAPFESIKALVDAGAPLWFQDDEGVSALHAAAYVENEELIRYLLEQGAVWNAGTCSFSLLLRHEC